MQSDPILDAIRRGHTRFMARFAKRDNRAGTAPEWSDYPAGIYKFAITLRDKPYKNRPKGEILSITPIDGEPGWVGADAWAEYTEASYCGNGEFLIEEYRMQLVSVAEPGGGDAGN